MVPGHLGQGREDLELLLLLLLLLLRRGVVVVVGQAAGGRAAWHGGRTCEAGWEGEGA